MNNKPIKNNLSVEQEEMLRKTQANKIRSKLLKEKMNMINRNGFESDDVIPLSGGNALAVNEYISIYANSDTGIYRWFLYQARYFTSLQGVKNCDPLKRIWRSLQYIIFFYGSGAVLKVGNKFLPMGVVSYELNINQDIIKGLGWVNNMSFIGATKKVGKQWKLSEDNSVFMKSNYQGIPGVWYYFPFCKNMVSMLKSFRTNLYLNTKKFKYICSNNNSEIVSQEMDTLFNVENGLIVENRGTEAMGDGGANRFEEINLPKNDNDSILETIKSYKSLIYSHWGRDTNTNIKEGRVNSEEVSGENVSLEILRLDFKEEMEKFIERFNKKFNMQAILVDNSEEIRKRNAQEKAMEINQQQGTKNE